MISWFRRTSRSDRIALGTLVFVLLVGVTGVAVTVFNRSTGPGVYGESSERRQPPQQLSDRPKWSHPVDCEGALGCWLLADNAQVYLIRTQRETLKGEVTAYRSSDGRRKWTRRVTANADTAVLRDGHLLLRTDTTDYGATTVIEASTGRLELDVQGPVVVDGGVLYHRDSDTFRNPRDTSPGPPGHSGPHSRGLGTFAWRAEGIVVEACQGAAFAVDNGKIRALDARDGRWLWETAGADPTCAGDAVILRDAAVVRAIDSTSGRVRWEREVAGAGRLDVVGSEVVILRSPPPKGETSGRVALDLASGAPRWETATATGQVVGLASPDRALVFRDGGAADKYKWLETLDLSNGKMTRIEDSCIDYCDLPPKLSLTADGILVGLHSSELALLDPVTLQPRWKRRVPPLKVRAHTVGGGQLVLVEDNHLRAY